MRKSIWILGCCVAISCQEANKETDAQVIIDKAIEISGGKNYKSSRVSFRFRDIIYTSESGANGARTKAIRNILARNPRAFQTAGMGNPLLKLPPGEVACNCVRSRCLKLYCSCFHNGKVCKPNVCTCVECQNTEEDKGGHRKAAIQQALEKRPDAFTIKPREKGLGCACKNNRCIRKYCECFRTDLKCTAKCNCRLCENGKPEGPF